MAEPKPNEKLWQAIKSAGMNQRRFADRVGVCPSFVSRVINGKWILDDFRKAVWSAHLGKKPEEIFGDN
jgi:transcriptional regulator with XRE-family HTH domain